ncbi:HalOD1 output domain-containing protein [Natronococcus roseus]|uniref:HalOD1 output domain-containing protein n=1 Tax=Natronococcus roseus TaxID=1052014 RepID=UPI00374DABAE
MTDENNPRADAEPVVQTRYSSDEPTSEAVVRALAVVKGIEPMELDALCESIDPEALDSLFGDPVISDEPPTRIEFSVSDYLVVVSSNGRIAVLELDEQ